MTTTEKVKQELIDVWRAKRLADLEGRTDTAQSLERRMNALLDCLPRAAR